MAFIKIVTILLTNETFFNIDENGLRVLNEIKLYIWNPAQRFEIGIEAYTEIFKIVIVAANFAVVSQVASVVNLFRYGSKLFGVDADGNALPITGGSTGNVDLSSVNAQINELKKEIEIIKQTVTAIPNPE